MIPHEMVTTAFDLPGFRTKRNLGVVRGIVVRSRSLFGTIGAGLQTLVGGNITLLTNLCEQTRGQAFDLMLQHISEPALPNSHVLELGLGPGYMARHILERNAVITNRHWLHP